MKKTILIGAAALGLAAVPALAFQDAAPEGKRGPPAEAIRELSHRHRDEEPREPVDGDGQADRRLGHPEGPGVERQHGDDAPEPELVDRDQDAHPDQDPDVAERRAAHGPITCTSMATGA